VEGQALDESQERKDGMHVSFGSPGHIPLNMELLRRRGEVHEGGLAEKSQTFSKSL